jgi:hypothetical protein
LGWICHAHFAATETALDEEITALFQDFSVGFILINELFLMPNPKKGGIDMLCLLAFLATVG